MYSKTKQVCVHSRHTEGRDMGIMEFNKKDERKVLKSTSNFMAMLQQDKAVRRTNLSRATSHTYYHNGENLVSSEVLVRLCTRYLEQGHKMDRITLKQMEYFDEFITNSLSKKGWQCLSKFAQRHHRDLLNKEQ